VNDPTEPKLPQYDMLHLDPEGLLWIGAAVRDPRWRHIPQAEREAVAIELYDGRVEVIDPDAGVVLASVRYDGPPAPVPPLQFMPRTRHAFRVVEDSVGLGTIEIFEIHLVRMRR
jgi:hypothetical protein